MKNISQNCSQDYYLPLFWLMSIFHRLNDDRRVSHDIEPSSNSRSQWIWIISFENVDLYRSSLCSILLVELQDLDLCRPCDQKLIHLCTFHINISNLQIIFFFKAKFKGKFERFIYHAKKTYRLKDNSSLTLR